MTEVTSSSNRGADAHAECCASPPDLSAEVITSTAEERFSEFMKEISSDGAIPVRTKELMAVALSILSKCEPCVKTHLGKARAMGISEEEINEAVWMAIAYGGAPTMMFYDSVMERV